MAIAAPLLATLETRLRRVLDAGLGGLLRQGLLGLEKECLRVAEDGGIAQTAHPVLLGSALTHPYLTTDFSEALLEFVTPPLTDRRALLDFLTDCHRFVYEHLDEEILWAGSMPCRLQGPDSVPIARYGSSNPGRMKTLYRQGLALRYGRTMQCIAGIHCNYSLPTGWWQPFQDLEGNRERLQLFVADRYLGMIRNLQRVGWLIPYLFGASPAVSGSFLEGRPTDLQRLNGDTFYYPYATSLRMGDIGYQNSQEEGQGFRANYDSLDSYLRSITWAMETSCPDYEQIGVRVNGEYRQLNANVLQIENEHYSSVRPKQPPEWLEKPSLALWRRGVAYVELRSLDLNPYVPVGIAEEQLHFVEVFLLFCLLADSPRSPASEARAINRNQILTAHRGREPGLELYWQGGARPLRELAQETLTAMMPLAQVLDGDNPERPYRRVIQDQLEVAAHPELTPSARLLEQMGADGSEFLSLVGGLSELHRRYFMARRLIGERRDLLEKTVRESWERQVHLEREDQRPFDQFLDEYFSQSR